MSPSTPRALVSFSGGKDSMLALHRAKEDGARIEGLVCMLDETGTRSRSHGVPRALVEAQAAALGLPCVLVAASWAAYEGALVAALRDARARGVEAVVFGDIDLDPHRAWEERVCAAADLRAILPLWHAQRHEVVRDVLRLGYRARVVCVNARWLDASFVGRELDASFVADLPAGVDACGENGEFHTFVFAGPLFAAPVPHAIARVRRIEARHELGDATYFVADFA